MRIRSAVHAAAAAIAILAATPLVAEHWRPIGPEASAARALSHVGDGRTVWLATWEPRLYRSDDAGQTWSATTMPPGEYLIEDVAGDPTNPRVAWALRGTAISRTDDRGATWELVLAGTTAERDWLGDLFFGADGTIYAAGGALRRYDALAGSFVVIAEVDSFDSVTTGADGSVWLLTYQTVRRSHDRGLTWVELPWSLTVCVGYRAWLVADPVLPERLWAGAPCNLTSRLLRSDDGGHTFVEIGPEFWYLGPIQVHPLRGNVLFGDATVVDQPEVSGLLRSDDGGLSWRRLPGLPPMTYWGATLSIDPFRPSRMLVASHAYWAPGILRSTDGGERWSEVASGLRGEYVTQLATDAAAPGRLWALVGEVLYHRSSPGAAWRRQNPHPLSRVNSVTSDPHLDDLGWANTYHGLARTLDGGSSWELVTATREDEIQADPLDSGVLYSGGVVEMYDWGDMRRSEDGGLTWTNTGLDITYRTRIVADPHKPASRATTGEVCDGGRGCDGWAIAAESLDHGRHWRRINVAGWEVAFAYSPAERGVAFLATADRGLYRRAAGSANWQRIDHARYLDLVAGRTELYALTIGPGGVPRVRRSSDGRHWRAISAAVDSSRPAHRLHVVPGDPDTVYALTSHGVLELGP